MRRFTLLPISPKMMSIVAAKLNGLVGTFRLREAENARHAMKTERMAA